MAAVRTIQRKTAADVVAALRGLGGSATLAELRQRLCWGSDSLPGHPDLHAVVLGLIREGKARALGGWDQGPFTVLLAA